MFLVAEADFVEDHRYRKSVMSVDYNEIELCVSRELHANVTRNHKCKTMDELMRQVRAYLAKTNPQGISKQKRKAA